MIDYSRINGSHALAVGTEKRPGGVSRLWVLWSNHETTWQDSVHEPLPAPAGVTLIRSTPIDSGHAPLDPDVDMRRPTVAMVANGPLLEDL